MGGRKGRGRMERREIYSEETGFNDTSNSNITGAGEGPVKNRLFTNSYQTSSSLFIKHPQLPSKLVFQ